MTFAKRALCYANPLGAMCSLNLVLNQFACSPICVTRLAV